MCNSIAGWIIAGILNDIFSTRVRLQNRLAVVYLIIDL